MLPLKLLCQFHYSLPPKQVRHKNRLTTGRLASDDRQVAVKRSTFLRATPPPVPTASTIRSISRSAERRACIAESRAGSSLITRVTATAAGSPSSTAAIPTSMSSNGNLRPKATVRVFQRDMSKAYSNQYQERRISTTLLLIQNILQPFLPIILFR